MAAFDFGRLLNPRTGKRERLATDGTVKTLTETAYIIQPSTDGKNAKRSPSGAFIQVLTASIYFSLEGTTPAVGAGLGASAGDTITLTSLQQIQNFKVTQNSGAGALEVLYFYGS